MNTATATTLLLLASLSGYRADAFDNSWNFQGNGQPSGYGSPPPPPNNYGGSSAQGLPPYYNYCEAGKMTTGTYQPVPGAQLVHVQVATRHGDRTATSAIIPGDPESWDCTNSQEVVGIFTGGKEGVKSARIKYDLPKDNLFRESMWKGSCLDGQLTPVGVKQHSKLGAELRRIYVDKLKFLPKRYSKSEVYARATDRPRTRLSAIALMDGLYSKKQRSGRGDLAIHVQPLDWDFMKSHEEKCPKLGKISSAMKKEAMLMQHIEKGKPLKADLNILLQTQEAKKFQSSDLIPFQDVLMTRFCHKKKFPCGPDGRCVTESMLRQIQQHVNQHNAIKHLMLPQSKDYVRYSYGPLIGEMRDHLLKVVNGQSKKKFELYSGHDNTLYGVLAGLGMVKEDFLWPPYASNFVIELWKTSSAAGPQSYGGYGHLQRRSDFESEFYGQQGGGAPPPGFGAPQYGGSSQGNPKYSNYLVRIIYNGRPFKSTACNFATGCPLNQFLQVCDQAVPRDFAMECSLDGKRLTYRVATARAKEGKGGGGGGKSAGFE